MSKRHVLILYSTEERSPVQSQSMSVALYRHLHRGEFTER